MIGSVYTNYCEFMNSPVLEVFNSSVNVSVSISIGARIKKIREIRGLNLKDVAEKMEITAVTYKSIETENNPKYSVLEKFCRVMGIDLPFLLSDVPVTEDNIHLFDSVRDKSFLLTHEQLRQKVEVYSDLLKFNNNYPEKELEE